jgi:prophage antirepressor-like protein/uncharacterized protein involved in tolerance to divalent cations
MSDITIFNNDLFGEVRTILINDKIYFVASDVATALGYAKPNNAINNHCKHIEKTTVDVIPQNEASHNKARKTQEMSIIPESDVYRLIIKSKLPAAEKFEEWVMEEVLPSIRQNKCYIAESATKEDIDFAALYASNRIYKTFMETENIRKEYEQFFTWAKAKREKNHHAFNNQDRIKLSKTVLKAINDRMVNELLTAPSSTIISYKELYSDIQTDITKLYNKHNGGIKRSQTVLIKKQASEIAELTEKVNELEDKYSLPELYLLNICPFSENYQYELTRTGTGRKKTSAYHYWIKQFHELEFPSIEDLNIDPTKKMKVYFSFACPEAWDTLNCHKALIDQLSKHYGFDDNLIEPYECLGKTVVNTKQDGYMWFGLVNIE